MSSFLCSSHGGIICFKFWRGAPAGGYRCTSSSFLCSLHGGIDYFKFCFFELFAGTESLPEEGLDAQQFSTIWQVTRTDKSPFSCFKPIVLIMICRGVDRRIREANVTPPSADLSNYQLHAPPFSEQRCCMRINFLMRQPLFGCRSHLRREPRLGAEALGKSPFIL